VHLLCLACASSGRNRQLADVAGDSPWSQAADQFMSAFV